MALLHIGFDQINESHLQRLIEAGAAESREIEYKCETYGTNDDAKAEFLADVSSFANTIGGDLISGMVATKGVPIAFEPFTDDPDAELLRLQNMARDGLQPRIANLQLKAVPLSQGGAALVIRVPRSYNPPHRVIFKRKNRFWARSSAGKYEPDVDELRAIFTLAPQLTDRIRGLRIDRTAKIVGGETPVALMGTCYLVMHVVPFSAFDLRAALNLQEVAQHPDYFPNLFSQHTRNWRVNFDGFLTLSNADEAANQQRAYVQVFRSGSVEAVASIAESESPGIIDTLKLETAIISYSRLYAAGLHACGVDPPLAVLVSLLGTRGRQMTMSKYVVSLRTSVPDQDPATVLERDQLHFAEVIFEEVPIDNQSCASMLRPILDQLANAAGHASTPHFDAAGMCLLPICELQAH